MSDAFDELGARPELYRVSLPHPGLLRHGKALVSVGEDTDLYFSSDYAFPSGGGTQLQALVHSVSDPLKAGYLDATLLSEDAETGIKTRDACRLATSVSGPRDDGAKLAAGEALAGAMGEDFEIDGTPHKLVRIWADEAAPEPAVADFGWVPAAGLRAHRAADPTPDSEDEAEVFGGAPAGDDADFGRRYGFDDTIAGALDAAKAVIDSTATADELVPTPATPEPGRDAPHASVPSPGSGTSSEADGDELEGDMAFDAELDTELASMLQEVNHAYNPKSEDVVLDEG
jgi:hypothetical protein